MLSTIKPIFTATMAWNPKRRSIIIPLGLANQWRRVRLFRERYSLRDISVDVLYALACHQLCVQCHH